MYDLSIVIVTYNDIELVDKCLTSIFNIRSSYKFTIILIDNASSDGTVNLIREKYPSVNIIENNSNIGYPAANNIALCQVSIEYVLLLNPDVELPSYALDRLLEYMDAYPEVGIVSPKLVRPDGRMDLACRRMFPNYTDYWVWLLQLTKLFPKNRMFGRYNLTYLKPDEETEIESGAGAFLLVRAKAIAEVGLMDERFFLYGEDLDWCYRFTLANWKIVYLPDVVVLHHKGGTTRRFSQRLIYHFYRSNALLYKKHIASNTHPLLNIAMYMAIWIKFGASFCYNLLLPKSKKRVA